MATRTAAQLSFVADTRSDAWIAQETGIPRSTVGFVRRGERDLPEQYSTAIRALYQREAYDRMKETGFSAMQANRFRSYAPDSVRYYMAEVSNKISELAWGLAIQLKESDEESGIFNSLESYYQDAADQIKEGFQHSIKQKEDWDQYGAGET